MLSQLSRPQFKDIKDTIALSVFKEGFRKPMHIGYWWGSQKEGDH
jgi:hypothetical protein